MAFSLFSTAVLMQARSSFAFLSDRGGEEVAEPVAEPCANDEIAVPNKTNEKNKIANFLIIHINKNKLLLNRPL